MPTVDYNEKGTRRRKPAETDGTYEDVGLEVFDSTFSASIYGRVLDCKT